MAESQADSTPNMAPPDSVVAHEGHPAVPDTTAAATETASLAAASALSPVPEDGGDRDDNNSDESSITSLDMGARETITLTREQLQDIIADATRQATASIQSTLDVRVQQLHQATTRDMRAAPGSINSIPPTFYRSTPGPPPSSAYPTATYLLHRVPPWLQRTTHHQTIRHPAWHSRQGHRVSPASSGSHSTSNRTSSRIYDAYS